VDFSRGEWLLSEEALEKRRRVVIWVTAVSVVLILGISAWLAGASFLPIFAIGLGYGGALAAGKVCFGRVRKRLDPYSYYTLVVFFQVSLLLILIALANRYV
jgi:hypothetical protein